MEQLRQVIGLRSYGQRDPLVEYKKEAFELFSNLLEKLKLDYVTILINLKVVLESSQEKENNQNDISKQASNNPTPPENPSIVQETSSCHVPPPTSIDTAFKPLQSIGY